MKIFEEKEKNTSIFRLASISVTKVSQPPTRPVRVEEENIYANIDDLPGSSSVTEPSTTSSSTNVSRIAAVRELIETEQRYVDDLRVVQEDFIDTLIQSRVLTQEENQQIFINWKNLIECNSRLLEAFKEKVDFREQTETNGSTHRNLRSGSASNLVLQNQQVKLSPEGKISFSIFCFVSFRFLREVRAILDIVPSRPKIFEMERIIIHQRITETEQVVDRVKSKSATISSTIRTIRVRVKFL